MPHFLKFHVPSGVVVNKFSVPEPHLVAAFASPDHDFLEVQHDTSVDCYISQGAICTPVEITRALPNLTASVGEAITVAGLPLGSWAQLDTGELVPVEDGTLTLVRDHEDNFSVRIAGAYTSQPFRAEWLGLDAIKARAKDQVDLDAEAARARIVTPGSGQAMTYLRKADAARTFLSGGDVSQPQMLRLVDEADRAGVSVEEAAQAIVARADSWEGKDAEIDSLRLDAKHAIAMSESGNEVAVILAGINWPS
jgi:hypothetical protein